MSERSYYELECLNSMIGMFNKMTRKECLRIVQYLNDRYVTHYNPMQLLTEPLPEDATVPPQPKETD